MMPVVVDPYLFTMPEEGATKEEVMCFVDRILEWSDVFNERADFIVCGQAMVKVYELNMNPSYSNLEKLFARYDLDFYTPMDIFHCCEKIFSNTPNLEDRVSAADLITVEGNDTVILFQ